jgi:signal transduction histidine kinase
MVPVEWYTTAMKWLKKLIHPFIAFIAIQLVWLTLVVLWIYWFVGRNRELHKLAERYKADITGSGLDWLVLTEGLILLTLILAGVYVIFLYWKRQSALYQQQKNFISQVTHELKSPLASIQLHLETIRLRNPPPDKLQRFVDTMLTDTGRLNTLISNLLLAARLDHQQKRPRHPVIDFSAFITDYAEQRRATLPAGSVLAVSVEQGIHAAIDKEGMQTVLRNLFENSELYCTASPDISLALKNSGRHCILTFQDKGIGIERKNLGRVFQMFYRVRRPGENIRGTGLGLYIVKSIITEHGGTIRASSEGIGTGCTFHITLPVADASSSRGTDNHA